MSDGSGPMATSMQQPQALPNTMTGYTWGSPQDLAAMSSLGRPYTMEAQQPQQTQPQNQMTTGLWDPTGMYTGGWNNPMNMMMNPYMMTGMNPMNMMMLAAMQQQQAPAQPPTQSLGTGTAANAEQPWPWDTANQMGNQLGDYWFPFGDPFEEQFGSSPLSLLNQMVSQMGTASATGPAGTNQSVNPLAQYGLGVNPPPTPTTTPVQNNAGSSTGAQQPPWWSAFFNTPGVPAELKDPKYFTYPQNFANMWGFQNPASLPLQILMSSRPIHPAQVAVPPISIPPPFAPVIQPGNPAPPANFSRSGPRGDIGAGEGGGGEGGGGGGPSTGNSGYGLSYTVHDFLNPGGEAWGVPAAVRFTSPGGGDPQTGYQGPATVSTAQGAPPAEQQVMTQAYNIAQATGVPVSVSVPAQPARPATSTSRAVPAQPATVVVVPPTNYAYMGGMNEHGNQ